MKLEPARKAELYDVEDRSGDNERACSVPAPAMASSPNAWLMCPSLDAIPDDLVANQTKRVQELSRSALKLSK